MNTEKYEVIIWYDTAPKPDHTERRPSHTDKEEFETVEEAKEFIERRINVDDLEEAGHEYDGRKDYGYWSGVKDRQTGKQWYEWGTVEIRKIKREKIEINEVIK